MESTQLQSEGKEDAFDKHCDKLLAYCRICEKASVSGQLQTAAVYKRCQEKMPVLQNAINGIFSN